ncbi:MAG TPA: acetyl-CoA carboxylase biotin carboxylase subunit [Acidobacteriota bacterium]|nr:acetyl-CoA carboxylase biotin carboxylase subunit [Acidobacteriota bacterium]
MFKRILIANRGEIAVRVLRACRDMDIETVAVFSDADRHALHVKMADQAFHIGPSPSSQSYLVGEKILAAARRSEAEAIHPGYGFLSENEGFRKACDEAGVVFIGPSAHSISVMGDKIASRQTMIDAGVPVIPGTEGSVDTLEKALATAGEIGYPVMLKASAGGGGKGMRVCENDKDLRSAFDQARNEAQASFSDPTVFLEKFLRHPRHIEVQVLGDAHGNRIHLGERECSIQRRHQKVVEECPSPVVDEDLRARLGETALKAAEAVDYFSAGTVEMLMDEPDEEGQRPFYFLEMNTRLQVEHPVTELVTGVDLVIEQIKVAAGRKLGCRQQDIQLSGAAIECRVYAEDPFNNFFPSPGQITTLYEPAGPGIRNDSGVYEGFEIPIQYDPMISKLVAHGADRDQAVRRMKRALDEYRIGGLRTNLPFFEVLLRHPAFLEGELSTDFIQRHGLMEELKEEQEDQDLPLLAAAVQFYLDSRQPSAAPARSAAGSPAKREHQSPSRSSAWKDYGRFNNRW